MGTVIDLETGKVIPPKSSNPFPWVSFIDTPEGGYARFQIDHDRFVDIELSAKRAMNLCTDLALIATKLLREEK